MNSHIHYFDRDIWITEEVFHCNNFDISLKSIKKVYIDFKVNTALAAFFSFLGCFVLVIAAWFRLGDIGYFFLIPLVAAFGWLRYVLLNYVDIRITTDDKKTRKVLVTSMRNRRWAYEIEDYIKHQLNLLDKMP